MLSRQHADLRTEPARSFMQSLWSPAWLHSGMFLMEASLRMTLHIHSLQRNAASQELH